MSNALLELSGSLKPAFQNDFQHKVFNVIKEQDQRLTALEGKQKDDSGYIRKIMLELLEVYEVIQKPKPDALRTACGALNHWMLDEIEKQCSAVHKEEFFNNLRAIKSALAEDAPIEENRKIKVLELSPYCWVNPPDKTGDIKLHTPDDSVWITRDEIPKLIAWLTKAGA